MTGRDKVRERVIIALGNVLASAHLIEKAKSDGSTSLADDLLLDSIDGIELLMEIESELGIELDEDQFRKVRTVDDLIERVYEEISKNSRSSDIVAPSEKSPVVASDPEIRSDPGRCGSCLNFERLRWHRLIREDEAWQQGGNCPILSVVLSGENPTISQKSVYVSQSFGCIYHKPRPLTN